MTARTALGGGRSLVVIAAAAAVAIAAVIVAFALPGRSPGPAFPRLTAAAARARWPHLTLPNGTAVLSYPPTLRPIRGDKVAVSVARVSPAGAFQLYLNATPGKAPSPCSTGPPSGCGCCDPTTLRRLRRLPPQKASGSAAAPGRASSTGTSPRSTRTTSRRSPAWCGDAPAPASWSRPRRPPSGAAPARCCSGGGCLRRPLSSARPSETPAPPTRRRVPLAEGMRAVKDLT